METYAGRGWGGRPRWHPASPVTPEEKDASPPTMSPGRLDCAPDASGPSLLQGQAYARRESCRSVCVTLLFFPSCVWFFSLEPFHRNSGNKDLVFSWCSDVAGSVGWTLPPFPSPGDRFWSLEKCQILGPPAITLSPLPRYHPPLPHSPPG